MDQTFNLKQIQGLDATAPFFDFSMNGYATRLDRENQARPSLRDISIGTDNARAFQ